MDHFDILDRIKPRGLGGSLQQHVLTADGPFPNVERQEASALVVDAGNRTVVTVPAEEAALDPDSFLTRLRGRLVGAEQANRNGQFWTTGDLVFGVGTVAGGPLNWLHQERRIIGALTEARLVDAPVASEVSGHDGQQASAQFDREMAKAASVSAEERRKMAKSGTAMSDGSFPIPDESHLRSAIRLARTAAQRAHVIKRARALGLSRLIPDNWRQTASAEGWVLPHIEAEATMWSYLFPSETHIVREAAGMGKLFYSMECVSKNVECYGPNGCGNITSYADATLRTDRACEHIRSKASARRLINPVFQGAAIIVPPVAPGWANANVDLVRKAGSNDKAMAFTDGDEELAAQILAFIQGPASTPSSN